MMKKMSMLLIGLVVLVVMVGMSTAGTQQRLRDCDQDCCTCDQFVDLDGDGICDNCDECIPQGEDDDGDGIPNGQDDDYVAPKDGDGAQKGKDTALNTTLTCDACCTCDQFVDEDGDGICDNCGGCLPQGADDDGDGIPNGQDDDYTPPQDGDGQQKGKR